LLTKSEEMIEAAENGRPASSGSSCLVRGIDIHSCTQLVAGESKPALSERSQQSISFTRPADIGCGVKGSAVEVPVNARLEKGVVLALPGPTTV
jgi:hypothetical protein